MRISVRALSRAATSAPRQRAPPALRALCPGLRMGNRRPAGAALRTARRPRAQGRRGTSPASSPACSRRAWAASAASRRPRVAMPIECRSQGSAAGRPLRSACACADLDYYFFSTIYLLGQLGGRLGGGSGGIWRGLGAAGASSRARRCVCACMCPRARVRARWRLVAAGDAPRGRARRGTARQGPAHPSDRLRDVREAERVRRVRSCARVRCGARGRRAAGRRVVSAACSPTSGSLCMVLSRVSV